MSLPITQLLLVKYLFQKGQKALDEKGPYAPGLAVSLFQDSIELMARTIAKEVDAKIPEKAAFESLWDAVEAKLKDSTGKVLPLKAKAIDVNKARVGFKHFGNLPAREDVAKFESYAEQFLSIACKDYFDVKFEDVSLLDLLRHKKASEHLRAAEEALSANNPESTLDECALAFHYLEKPMSTLVPSLSSGLFQSERVGKPLANTVNALRDFVVATSLGVSFMDFIHFRAVIPGLSMAPSGDFQIHRWFGRHSDRNDAEFALKFATDYGIAVQEIIGGLSERDRKFLFGQES